MMKRGGVFFAGIIFLFLISFASAQLGSFTLSELLSSIEPSLIILGVIWIVSFAIVYFAISKTIFKEQNVIAAVIAFAVSLLITYGYNQSGYSFDVILPSMGISMDFLYSVIPIIFIAVVIFLFVKLKSTAFIAIGGFLGLITFIPNLVYTTTLLRIISLGLMVIGVWLSIKKRQKDLEQRGVTRSFWDFLGVNTGRKKKWWQS